MERVWVHVSRAPLFSFTVGRRTTVSSIHLRCAVEGRDNKVEIECSRFYLWAKYMPGTTTADGVLSDQPPHVVASFQLDETGLASSAGLTWMLAEGSAVAMQLMSQPHVPGILQQSAEELMTSLEDHNNAIASSDVTPEANSSPSCGPLNDITITLVGVEKERDEYISPWRPLLVYRWFELKQHVREATQIGSRSRGSMRPGSEVKFRKRPMLNGEVREATGLSSCGNYVLWQDGTLGYRRELVPYRRFFIPAREDKCVRVRSFPHRFADIVGEVPHGCVVEAIGRKKDPYTKEEYALLVLSGLPNAVALAETYELTSIERGKWVWGWSKIASSNGVVFLVEVCDLNGGVALDKTWVEQLPEPTYYTSVCDERRVRVRSGPSLSEDVIGHLEQNEVKLAVAVWHPVDPTSNQNAPSVGTQASTEKDGATAVGNGACAPHSLNHFVQWEDGGFSLLRNSNRVYLVPLELQKETRRFPHCPRPVPKSPDITPIYRKRGRESPASSDKSISEPEGASSQGLLSPSRIPEAVRTGIKAGRVRLEDLPIVAGGDGSDSSSFTLDGDSS